MGRAIGIAEPALAIDAPMAEGAMTRKRVRVRTPGKHIVLFLVAVVLILSLSTSVLEQRRDLAAGIAFVKSGDLYHAPFAPIIADLATDERGRDRFVSLTPTIILSGEAARRELSDNEALIRERMTMLLRSLTSADFEDEAGMTRVKEALRQRVNLILDTDGAREVIINDLVIQ